jgi:diphthamide synthase subunit DPH2
MSRVIALEEGLEDIGDYLRNKGFQVVAWDDQNSAVDAVVYMGCRLEEIQSSQFLSATESVYDYTGGGSYGVLLVNAQNRTPQEVYEIIRNRVYEHFI